MDRATDLYYQAEMAWYLHLIPKHWLGGYLHLTPSTAWVGRAGQGMLSSTHSFVAAVPGKAHACMHVTHGMLVT